MNSARPSLSSFPDTLFDSPPQDHQPDHVESEDIFDRFPNFTGKPSVKSAWIYYADPWASSATRDANQDFNDNGMDFDRQVPMNPVFLAEDDETSPVKAQRWWSAKPEPARPAFVSKYPVLVMEEETAWEPEYYDETEESKCLQEEAQAKQQARQDARRKARESTTDEDEGEDYVFHAPTPVVVPAPAPAAIKAPEQNPFSIVRIPRRSSVTNVPEPSRTALEDDVTAIRNRRESKQLQAAASNVVSPKIETVSPRRLSNAKLASIAETAPSNNESSTDSFTSFSTASKQATVASLFPAGKPSRKVFVIPTEPAPLPKLSSRKPSSAQVSAVSPVAAAEVPTASPPVSDKCTYLGMKIYSCSLFH